MLDTLRDGDPGFHHLTARSTAGKLLLQARMRVRLDVQYVVPAIAGDLAKVRGVSVQGIFYQDHRQIVVAFSQSIAQPLGDVALAIALFRSVPRKIGSKSSGKTSRQSGTGGSSFRSTQGLVGGKASQPSLRGLQGKLRAAEIGLRVGQVMTTLDCSKCH
jgi:hypothetical protein